MVLNVKRTHLQTHNRTTYLLLADLYVFVYPSWRENSFVFRARNVDANLPFYSNDTENNHFDMRFCGDFPIANGDGIKRVRVVEDLFQSVFSCFATIDDNHDNVPAIRLANVTTSSIWSHMAVVSGL